MKIDGITINIFNDSDNHLLEDQYEILLFTDSGDDIYPENIEIPDSIQEKINQIRKICF